MDIFLKKFLNNVYKLMHNKSCFGSVVLPFLEYMWLQTPTKFIREQQVALIAITLNFHWSILFLDTVKEIDWWSYAIFRVVYVHFAYLI